ncbi:Uncharacterized protein C14orf80-like [Stylophora pistillata]|uniref:Uncharacterized protein C14orf80-like n=1 Tax=Stylophora pistillata TaxID=50429 RepID=A0A2B4RQ23_STYPI|nr:Uncharacterized protein C14orf80-like [Stylophora pistillata]
MAQIRETIEALCTVLSSQSTTQVSAESFRLAKFDKDEATESLWLTIRKVLSVDDLEPEAISGNNMVAFCKHELFHKGYGGKSLYQLPEDMSRGSRELILALGWLIAKEDVTSALIAKLEPVVFEDPPLNLTLYEKIPLAKGLDACSEPIKQNDFDSTIDLAERLILKYNKLHTSLKSLLGARNEHTRVICKLHSIPKSSKSQSSSHFSSQDIYFLRYPNELAKYQERLEWFCDYTKALVCWSLNELTFWKWMETVLDAKILEDAAKDTDEQCDDIQQKQGITPSSDLQIAKGRQVRLSQILNAQEPTYRKVSKTWKKIKASLQSCEEGRANLADALSLLDSKLLSEIRELQKYTLKCQEKPKAKDSVCLRKLTQGESNKVMRTTKDTANKSMASEQISRLRQEKEALQNELRSLEEVHREKLLQICQVRQDLVCISPGKNAVDSQGAAEFNTNQRNDHLPASLLAQLVEHCTGIAEVMGSNPVQA